MARVDKAARSDYNKSYRQNMTEERREQNRARGRAWYAANKDREKARKAREYASNPQREKRTAWQAAWRAANLEKSRELARKYDREHRQLRKEKAALRRAKNPQYWANRYVNNRAAILAATTAWAKAHPDVRRAIKVTRRLREKGASGKVTASTVKNLMTLQKGKCIVCRISLDKKYHIDHIVPLARSGDNSHTNLQLLCPSCNCSKNAKDPIKFMQQKGYLL